MLNQIPDDLGIPKRVTIRALWYEFTAHGFRSAFRALAGDQSEYPGEVAEASLAHRIGAATEQAYRRSDALERRRGLMQDWADFSGSHRGG